jgi:hypothetical protein
MIHKKVVIQIAEGRRKAEGEGGKGNEYDRRDKRNF